jgi:hypothetical protein
MRVSSRLDDGAAGLPHDIGERLRVARQQAVAAAVAQQARLGVLARPAAEAHTVVLTAPGAVLAGAGQGMSLPSAPYGMTVRGHNSRDIDHGRRLDDAPPSWGWRIASALPVLALVVGLWGINVWHQREQVQAATEVDMALLTDDLPPSAYADPGFEEYLSSADAPATDIHHTGDQDAITTSSDLLPDINADIPETVGGSTSPHP